MGGHPFAVHSVRDRAHVRPAPIPYSIVDGHDRLQILYWEGVLATIGTL